MTNLDMQNLSRETRKPGNRSPMLPGTSPQVFLLPVRPGFYSESPVAKHRRNGLLAGQAVYALATLTCMSKKADRPDCEYR